MADNQNNGSDNLFLLMGASIGIILGGAALYHYQQGFINLVLIGVAKAQMAPFWPFSARVQHAWEVSGSRPSKTFSFTEIAELLAFSGSYFRWFLVPLLLLAGWLVYSRLGWLDKLSRTFDMQSLVRHNEPIAACLSPIIRRGHFITEESSSKGPWRVAESPMLFAIRRGIIVQRGKPVKEHVCFQESGLPRPGVSGVESFVFDRHRAREVLTSRMGPLMPNDFNILIHGEHRVPRYMRGIMGACCAVALGNRTAAQSILDAMSRSFPEKEALASRKDGVPGDFPINILNADAWIIRALSKRPQEDASTEAIRAKTLQDAIAVHSAYLYVWMGVMLNKSREKGGTIPPQEFLWLRPCNRELWYFLSSVGGTGCHTEGSAPWSHREAERVLGRPIHTPYIDPAVKALEVAIKNEGWLTA